MKIPGRPALFLRKMEGGVGDVGGGTRRSRGRASYGADVMCEIFKNLNFA